MKSNAWIQVARRTPAWFTEGVMYQIKPRATPFVPWAGWVGSKPGRSKRVE